MSTYIFTQGFFQDGGQEEEEEGGGHLPPLGYAESSTLHANKVKPL